MRWTSSTRRVRASGSPEDADHGAEAPRHHLPRASAPATPAPDYAAGASTTSTTDTGDGTAAGEGPDGATPAAVRGPQLAPAALNGMVEEYLRDHPGEEFGPTKIGHDLGRSNGAVRNALKRLVATGYAVRTKDRPKR